MLDREDQVIADDLHHTLHITVLWVVVLAAKTMWDVAIGVLFVHRNLRRLLVANVETYFMDQGISLLVFWDGRCSRLVSVSSPKK